MYRGGVVEVSSFDGAPELGKIQRDLVEIESHCIAIGDDASAEDPSHHGELNGQSGAQSGRMRVVGPQQLGQDIARHWFTTGGSEPFTRDAGPARSPCRHRDISPVANDTEPAEGADLGSYLPNRSGRPQPDRWFDAGDERLDRVDPLLDVADVREVVRAVQLDELSTRDRLGPQRKQRSTPAASSTARVSSTRSSIVGTATVRSDAPVPRLSKCTTRQNRPIPSNTRRNSQRSHIVSMLCAIGGMTTTSR